MRGNLVEGIWLSEPFNAEISGKGQCRPIVPESQVGGDSALVDGLISLFDDIVDKRLY